MAASVSKRSAYGRDFAVREIDRDYDVVDLASRNLNLSSAPCNSLIIPSALTSRQSRIYGVEIVQATPDLRKKLRSPNVRGGKPPRTLGAPVLHVGLDGPLTSIVSRAGVSRRQPTLAEGWSA